MIKPVVIPAESRHVAVPMMTAEGLQSAASSLKLEMMGDVRMSEKSNQYGEYRTEDPTTYNLRQEGEVFASEMEIQESEL